MGQAQIPHVPVKEFSAALANIDQQVYRRAAVNSGDAGNAAQARSFNKQLKHGQLPVERESVHGNRLSGLGRFR
jgi:hypothetical protein